MGLTKDFKKTTYARVQRDAAFRKALLTEAVNAYLSGKETIGKLACSPSKGWRPIESPSGIKSGRWLHHRKMLRQI